MLGLFVLLGLLTSATAEYGCSDFTQLTHTMNGCPANQGNPDCSFIQANAQHFCSTVATSWEIINGPACNLRGAGYGCIFASGLYSTTDQFCCPLIITGGTPSPSASSSPSSVASSSQSANPSLTPSAYASLTPSAYASLTPSASTSSSANPSFTPSASPSASQSARPSFSVTPSSYPSLSPKPTLSATATATATSTGTFTAIPSTNVTTIYITTTSSTISSGVGAAIGLSAVFGFCILGACCAGLLRRRPAPEIQRQVTIVERRASVVEGKERRKSTTEDGKERRKSTLEIRAVN